MCYYYIENMSHQAQAKYLQVIDTPKGRPLKEKSDQQKAQAYLKTYISLLKKSNHLKDFGDVTIFSQGPRQSAYNG